jgi:hypothetical protein
LRPKVCTLRLRAVLSIFFERKQRAQWPLKELREKRYKINTQDLARRNFVGKSFDNSHLSQNGEH